MTDKGEEGTTSNPKKTCFVICPIGDAGSVERKWSDDLFDCIITPIVEKMGYQKPIRADQINESGIITRQIVDLLIDSDLVIADLSFRNPNVCYELAVRHVAKKPFIHMIKNGDKIPFDTASNRAITVDTDIRSANKAMEDLERHISSIESGKNEMDNPIGTALTLRDLRSSGDPSQMISADLMEAIQSIAAEVKLLREVKLNPYAYTGPSGNVNLMESFLNADRFSELLIQYRDTFLNIQRQKAQKFPESAIADSENRLKAILKQLQTIGMSQKDMTRFMNSCERGSDY
jgi:hypothetical protein